MKQTILLAIAISLTLSRDAGAEIILAVTSQRELISFDSATPGTIASSVAITGIQDQIQGEAINAIDFRPATGQLYALGNAPGSIYRLYTMNTTTGAVTKIGSDITGITGSFMGFDFNPSVDLIRIVTDTDQNFRFNPNNAALVSADTALAYAAGDPGNGFNPNIVGSAYSNNTAGAATTTLFGIDSGRDVLVTKIPPNSGTLNTIGALGVDFQNFAGFDISGTSGTAFATTTDAALTSTNLYSINLATGGASLLGQVGNDLVINDIAAGVNAVPEPTSIALLLLGSCGIYGLRRRPRFQNSRLTNLNPTC